MQAGFSPFVPVTGLSPGGSVATTITGLVSGKTYKYAIKDCDAVGNGSVLDDNDNCRLGGLQ